MMKIVTTAFAEQNIFVDDLVVVYIGWNGSDVTGVQLVRSSPKEIGFVEAKMADPELVAGIETYRAGKLQKKDA